MPTSVALSHHFESFVRAQVDSGRFNNVSEVVRAGLRLLENHESEQAAKLQALREAVVVGLASGPCATNLVAVMIHSGGASGSRTMAV